MLNIKKILMAIVLTSFLGGITSPVFANSHNDNPSPYTQEHKKEKPPKKATHKKLPPKKEHHETQPPTPDKRLSPPPYDKNK